MTDLLTAAREVADAFWDLTDTWPMFRAPRCVFCALPVDAKRPAVLHLNAYGRENPRNWRNYDSFDEAQARIHPSRWTTLAFGAELAALSHRECEHPEWGHGDMGYHVPLDRLRVEGLDGPAGWYTHLREKNWFNPVISIALRQAYRMACAWRVPREQRTPAEVAETRSPRAARQKRVGLSLRIRSFVLERDGFRCRRCGNTRDDGVRLVVDHVVPVAAGGTNDLANLQTLCEPCNAGKAARPPHAHDLRELTP